MIMDVFDTHKAQYEHNKRFVKFGITNSNGSFYDWEVTAFFYAAVHLIEAVLFKEYSVINIRTHEERRDYIETKPAFNSIKKDYFKLISLSHTARYSGYIEINEDDSYKAQSYLENIESGLSKYIER